MPGRYALIVATDTYGDPKLSRLRAPARDAEALADVLRDPEIGGFEVELAANETDAALRRRIAAFFSDRARDSLLLLHFSCHGLKDDSGQLYFAAADTEVAHLDATAIPAEFVSRQMARSRSNNVLMLLDCCYSGAIARGLRFRAGDSVDVSDHLGGSGRAIITASNAMEYAFEGDELTGEGRPSVFTSAVVKALETGEADRDQDSWISVRELYDYVCDEVREITPNQRPNMLSHLEGELYVARSRVGRAGDAAARADRRPREPVRVGPRGRRRTALAELLHGRDRGAGRGRPPPAGERRRERRQPPREHRGRRRARRRLPGTIATTGRRRAATAPPPAPPPPAPTTPSSRRRRSAAAPRDVAAADPAPTRRRLAAAPLRRRRPPHRPTRPLRARPTPIRRPSPRLRGGVLRARSWRCVGVRGSWRSSPACSSRSDGSCRGGMAARGCPRSTTVPTYAIRWRSRSCSWPGSPQSRSHCSLERVCSGAARPTLGCSSPSSPRADSAPCSDWWTTDTSAGLDAGACLPVRRHRPSCSPSPPGWRALAGAVAPAGGSPPSDVVAAVGGVLILVGTAQLGSDVLGVRDRSVHRSRACSPSPRSAARRSRRASALPAAARPRPPARLRSARSR